MLWNLDTRIDSIWLSVSSIQKQTIWRALAGVTGLSLTNAILKALREQLARETGRSRASRLGDDLRAIGDRCFSLPDVDSQSAEEMLGFDEFGLPN